MSEEDEDRDTTPVSVRVVVAGVNAAGEPDFYACRVHCDQEQYDNGDHYAAAEELAGEHGYETRLAYDENDGPEWLFDAFLSWAQRPSVDIRDQPLGDD